MHKILLCIVVAAVAGEAGCATQTAAKQNYAVNVTYQYAADDQPASAWRAFMIALDKCHKEGYQDAYPAGQPVGSCDRASGNACAAFTARQSYDCVGQSYQAN